MKKKIKLSKDGYASVTWVCAIIGAVLIIPMMFHVCMAFDEATIDRGSVGVVVLSLLLILSMLWGVRWGLLGLSDDD